MKKSLLFFIFLSTCSFAKEHFSYHIYQHKKDKEPKRSYLILSENKKIYGLEKKRETIKSKIEMDQSKLNFIKKKIQTFTQENQSLLHKTNQCQDKHAIFTSLKPQTTSYICLPNEELEKKLSPILFEILINFPVK